MYPPRTWTFVRPVSPSARHPLCPWVPATPPLNLLVLNLGMDEQHPALGHVPAWTDALALRAGRVEVVTMFAGPGVREPNVCVHSLGKERGHSEPRRLVTLYRALAEVTRDGRIDVCFAHMAPLFAALAAPRLRAAGIPLALWYAHTATTRRLRLAHAVADRVLTPTPASFPFPSPKVVAIGHGVDTNRFRPPATASPRRDRTAIAVGRLNPIKGHAALIDALAQLSTPAGRRLRLEIVGGALTEADRTHEAELRRRARHLRVADRVVFRGEVAHGQIAPWYHRGAFLLNASGGALDKATLEGMASGCVPVSSNPSFAQVARGAGLDRLVSGPRPGDLARTLEDVLSAPEAERERLAARARAVVVRDHGLDGVADRIVEQLAELSAAAHRTRVAA